MIYAAILAGGIGRRMSGSKMPKQFLELEGKPLLVHTVAAFLHCEAIAHIVVAAAKGWLDETEDILNDAFGEEPRLSVTLGGVDRLGSMQNACIFLGDRFGIAPEDMVLTQDGARPFVTPEMIDANIRLMSAYDAVTTAYPVVDTILCSKDGTSVADIPLRKQMFAVQTPQTFRLGELLIALEELSPEEKEAITDGAKVYLNRGKTVGIAMGSGENIKITEPKDLAVARSILQNK